MRRAEPLSLVFLVDALGHEQVGRGGFLDHLAAPDQRPRVRSTFGFSSAVLPSIFTGRLPREHGHWSMYRRDRGDSVFRPYRMQMRLASLLKRGQWRARQWLAGRLRRGGLTGYFSLYEIPLEYLCLFDVCERRNIYRPRAFDGIPSIFDRLAEEGVPHRIWDWTVEPDIAFAEMEEAARQGNESLLFLYTAGLDSTMHIHGPQSEAAREWLRLHDERITRVVDAARAAGREVRLRVFGDHGMAPIRGEVDIMRAVKSLPLRMPDDYVMFLDSSMARFWFDSDEARRQIVARVESIGGGRFLAPEEMAPMGVDFPDHEYGEAIYLCDPGILIRPSFMGREALKGMHGYHPDDKDSFTTWIAHPRSDPAPASILDIGAILLGDLGISWKGR